MYIIKLDATASTNQYLKQLALENQLNDFTVVFTEKQTQGRGQMGADWISEPGKNLTFSILKKFKDFKVINQVYFNCAVSLALYDTLRDLSVPDLKVKWPNDIMSGNDKVCGILIENILKGNQIGQSIIGIGLNVNQRDFGELKNVSSLQLLLGRPIDLDNLMNQIVTSLKVRLKVLDSINMKDLKDTYESVLFRKAKPSTFLDSSKTRFMGFIKGLSTEGKLIIQLEDEVLKEFGVKEVRLLY